MCSARVDGLVRREQGPNEMKEIFKGREDFLCLRHVFYSKRVKKFEPAEVGNKRSIVVCTLYSHMFVCDGDVICVTENC